MHHELCRYVTEEECEESDLRMQEHIAAHKSLQVQVRENPNQGAINVGFSASLPALRRDTTTVYPHALPIFFLPNRFWF
jgi:hypothetical protein